MKRKEAQGHLAICSAEILWGAMSPATKMLFAGGLVTPLMLMDMRFIGAALLFWLFSPFVKQEHVPHGDMLKLFFASLLSIIFNQGMYSLSLSLTSPIDASICTTSMPLITMIIAAIILKEPITRLKVMGIIVGATGAVLLIESGQQESGGNQNSLLGDVCVLLAQTSFAFYLVLFKDLIKRYSAYTLMKWMFTYASLCILPFSYHSLSALFSYLPTFTSADWGNAALIVLGGTFVSYLLLPIGQHNLRPTVTAIYNYVQPLVATLIAILLGVGTFNTLKGIAVVLVFAGVACVTQSKSKAQIDAYKKRQKEA